MKLTIETGIANDISPFVGGNLYFTTNKINEIDAYANTYVAGQIIDSDLILKTSVNLKYFGNLEDNPRLAFKIIDNNITDSLENNENSLIGALVTIADDAFLYKIRIYSVTKDKGVLHIQCEGYQDYKESKLFTYGSYTHKPIETTIVRDWAGTYRDGQQYQYFRPYTVVDSRITPDSGTVNYRARCYGSGFAKYGSIMPYSEDSYVVHPTVSVYQTSHVGFIIRMITPDGEPILDNLKVFVEFVDGTGKGTSLPMSITPWMAWDDPDHDGYLDDIKYSPTYGYYYFVYARIADWNASVGFKAADNLPNMDGSTIVRISTLYRTVEVDSSFDLTENTFFTKDKDSDYLPIDSSIISKTGNIVSIKPTSFKWAETPVLPDKVTFTPWVTSYTSNKPYLYSGTPSALESGDSEVTWIQSTISTEPALNLQFRFDNCGKGFYKYKLKLRCDKFTKMNKVSFSMYATDDLFEPQNYNADNSPVMLSLDGNNSRIYQEADLTWVYEAELDGDDLFQEFFNSFGLNVYAKYNPTDGNSNVFKLLSVSMVQINKQDVNFGDVYLSGNTDYSSLSLLASGYTVSPINGGNVYQSKTLLEAWQDFAKAQCGVIQTIGSGPRFRPLIKEEDAKVINQIKEVSSLTDLRENNLGNDWTVTLNDGKKHTIDELRELALVDFTPSPAFGTEHVHTIYDRYVEPTLQASIDKYKVTEKFDLSFPPLAAKDFEAIAKVYAEWTSLVKKEVFVTVPYSSSVAVYVYLGDQVTFNHPDLLLNISVIGYVTGKEIDFLKKEITYRIWLISYTDESNWLIDQGATAVVDTLVDSGTDLIIEN